MKSSALELRPSKLHETNGFFARPKFSILRKYAAAPGLISPASYQIMSSYATAPGLDHVFTVYPALPDHIALIREVLGISVFTCAGKLPVRETVASLRSICASVANDRGMGGGST